MGNLYFEIYKTSLKKIEEDTKKWNYIPCLWIGSLSIVKITQSNLQIQWNPYQNPDIFHRNRTKRLKIYAEPQKTLIDKTSWEKRTELEVSHSLVSNDITKL